VRILQEGKPEFEFYFGQIKDQPCFFFEEMNPFYIGPPDQRKYLLMERAKVSEAADATFANATSNVRISCCFLISFYMCINQKFFNIL
jgi:hypothetical protein